MAAYCGAEHLKQDWKSVVVSSLVVRSPVGRTGGAIHYQFGKTIQNHKFERTGALDAPPVFIRGRRSGWQMRQAPAQLLLLIMEYPSSVAPKVTGRLSLISVNACLASNTKEVEGQSTRMDDIIFVLFRLSFYEHVQFHDLPCHYGCFNKNKGGATLPS